MEALLGVRGLRGARRAARRRRRPALQRPDGGHRVRHRARRRAEPARPGPGGGDPLAPSRCGKTPTTMYLALQHGLFVANYPLVDEDLETTDLPRPVRDAARPVLRALTTTVRRLSQVRQRAPPGLAVRLAGAVHASSCAGPTAMYAATRHPRRSTPRRRRSRRSPPSSSRPWHGRRRASGRPHPTATTAEEGPRTSTENDRRRPTTCGGSPTWAWTTSRSVGGKNASLGEMIRNLADAGVRVPGGFATTADAFRRFLGETGLADRDRRPAARASTPTTCARWPRSGARSARRSSSSRSRPTLEADIRAAYEQLAGGRRRGRRSPCAPARPPRTCPTPRSPASRRPSSTCAASTTCCTRSSEVFASLYNDRAIAYRVHQGFDARRRGAVGRRAAHGALATSAPSGVMFTLDTESGFRDVVFITSSLRPGRDGGAGRGQPRRVLRLQAGAARPGTPGDPASAAWAARRSRWSTPTTPSVGRTTEFVDVDAGRARRSFSLTDAEVERAGPAGARRSRSTTAARWTSSGARTASTASSTSCRRARRR